MSGKLYVVGTPIGNLGDFSERAKETLAKVDFIAAEDTRVTLKLLNKFNIKKPMLSYHEHNKQVRHSEIVDKVKSGENCALVTDAGMPAISDPGEDLVRLCLQESITVESVPGPSALITALSISGMPSGRFCFEGFLSVNKISRKKHLEEVKSETRTLIFYEAPHKLLATLKDMEKAFGNRRIALIKELTKLHETVEVTTFEDAVKKYSETPPKGEYVLIIEGAKVKEENREFTLTEAVKIAENLIAEGLSASASSKKAATISGLKKSDIYRELINNQT